MRKHHENSSLGLHHRSRARERCSLGTLLVGRWLQGPGQADVSGNQYPQVESKLQSLGRKLGKPQAGEWLAEHKEDGQTFAQYLEARPVRKSKSLNTIYVCLVGDFTAKQKEIIDRTNEYLEIYFATPVKVRKTLALTDIPDKAKRIHPRWGDKQILSTYILDEVLQADRPNDALAYLAFTASDLWPGDNWNFVFGQASLPRTHRCLVDLPQR